MNTTILPIRFGMSTREQLTETSRAVLHDLLKYIAPSTKYIGEAKIIWIAQNSKVARISMFDELQKSLTTTTTGEILIIDLGGASYRDITDPNLFLGLLDFCREMLERKVFSQAFVITPEDRSFEESDHQISLQLCEELAFNIVYLPSSGFGQRWRELEASDRDILTKLFSLYDQQSASNHDRLRKKVIRNVGRFRKPNSDDVDLYFYDFRRCHPEIVVAIEGYLAEQIPLTGKIKPNVFYFGGLSEWFEKAVLEATANIDDDVNLIALDDTDISLEVDASSILLLPVVRSSETLNGLLYGVEPDRFPKVWCLASVAEETDTVNGIRSIKIKHEGADRLLRIQCCLSFSEGNSDILELWKLIDCPDDGFEANSEGGRLNATSMWAMILMAGFADERYGSDRPRVSFLPDFPRMIDAHIGFIGNMMRDSCSGIFGPLLPSGITYVCVDEPCARRLGTEVSGSEYTKAVFVSRELVDFAFTADEGSFHALLSGETELNRQFYKLSDEFDRLARQAGGRDKLQLVGFDEFIISGKTTVGLEKVCRALNVSLEAYISVASFGDMTEEPNCIVHSFYDFPDAA